MIKKILFVALAVCAFSAIHAQVDKPFTFGAGVRLAYPTGDFGEGWGFGVGGELQGEARVASSVTIPFSVGYTRFIGKKFLGERLPGIGLIPILGGIRIYPSSNSLSAARWAMVFLLVKMIVRVLLIMSRKLVQWKKSTGELWLQWMD
jgi:hypothetical protein